MRTLVVAIPRLEGKCIDNCPTERENLAIFGGNRYLVPFNRGIATTSVRTGLAMTGNLESARQIPIQVIGFNKLVVKFEFVGFVPPIVGRGYDPAAHVPMREMYVLP